MTGNLTNRYINGNMHPVDALAVVREEMAALKKIEAELRDNILSNKDDRSGQLYKAEVVTASQRRVDQAVVAELVGDIEKVKRSFDVTFVMLKKFEVNA